VNEKAVEARLRLAALLVMVGIVVEIASLTWRHPTAFIVFVGIGGLLMAAGMSTFLWTIVSPGVSRGGE
jgi:hypothetical protein